MSVPRLVGGEVPHPAGHLVQLHHQLLPSERVGGVAGLGGTHWVLQTLRSNIYFIFNVPILDSFQVVMLRTYSISELNLTSAALTRPVSLGLTFAEDHPPSHHSEHGVCHGVGLWDSQCDITHHKRVGPLLSVQSAVLESRQSHSHHNKSPILSLLLSSFFHCFILN